jgi:hypothetical protein
LPKTCSGLCRDAEFEKAGGGSPRDGRACSRHRADPARRGAWPEFVVISAISLLVAAGVRIA